MGFNRAFLIVVAVLLLLPSAVAFAGKVACLHCHRPHYEERGACFACHRGDERSDRLRIAHHDLIPARFAWFALPGAIPVERGKKLLDSFACRRCHVTAGKGTRLASDLDRLPKGTTPQNMFDSIKSPAMFMPDFRFADWQLTDIVNAIMSGGQGVKETGIEIPLVVHFVTNQQEKENVLHKKCGDCHRALTACFGTLGKGDIGPNLAGLLSEHYPATLKNNGRWTVDILRKWLENPRKIRENSQMRPIPLKENEFEQLLHILMYSPRIN